MRVRPLTRARAVVSLNFEHRVRTHPQAQFWASCEALLCTGRRACVPKLWGGLWRRGGELRHVGPGNELLCYFAFCCANATDAIHVYLHPESTQGFIEICWGVFLV